MTREATLCLNNLNALRIFARISKFRCFHETKQTQNDVGKFFYHLAEFVFEFFCESRRIFANFAKFCCNSLFATYIAPISRFTVCLANLPVLQAKWFFATEHLLWHNDSPYSSRFRLDFRRSLVSTVWVVDKTVWHSCLTNSWVCPVIDHEFRHNIVKVAVDPLRDSRVDLQTTLTMLWRNS